MVEEFRLESGKSIWYFHPLKPLILWDSSCIIYLISAQFSPSVLSKFQSTDVDFNLETYRSGHNESDSKSFDPQGSVGSNPTVSARNYSQQLFSTAGFSFQFAASPRPFTIALADVSLECSPNVHRYLL